MGGHRRWPGGGRFFAILGRFPRRLPGSALPRPISPSSASTRALGLTATHPELIGKNNAELMFYTAPRHRRGKLSRGLGERAGAAGHGAQRGPGSLAAEIAECSPLRLVSTRATMRGRPRRPRAMAATNHELSKANQSCAPRKDSRKASKPPPNAASPIQGGTVGQTRQVTP